MPRLKKIWTAYKLRLRRRRLLVRAVLKRRQLKRVSDQTKNIGPDDILVFSTIRNERIRLPYFLEYYRKLGVDHFFFVDNNSDDGSAEYLASQNDVSLWTTSHSYKKSRFGVDWLTWLQFRFASGHWCLTLDADEFFVYPQCDTRPLRDLTGWLDQKAIASFGVIMLDMYPKGPLDRTPYQEGQDPFEILRWFDADNFTRVFQPRLQNIWIRGGVRARHFFGDRPERAPTLNKTPLVKWHWRYAYVSSTHTVLPRRLNHVFKNADGPLMSGALLHSKLLHTIVARSAEEKDRGEHFAHGDQYSLYYDGLISNPDLWLPTSVEYTGWQQLAGLGLFGKFDWD